MSDSQRIYKRITAAQVMETIPAPGNKCFVAACSAPFGLRCGNRNESIAGVGDLYDYGESAFNHVTVRNLIATSGVTLTVTLRVGTAYVTFNTPPIPNTKLMGWTVSLADAATANFVGIATDAAEYVAQGVSAGSRRKQLTVTLRPFTSPANERVEVYNLTTGKLLAIIGSGSSGNGFAIETDDDLQIKNKTGVTLTSDVDPKDISVAETFYL